MLKKIDDNANNYTHSICYLFFTMRDNTKKLIFNHNGK